MAKRIVVTPAQRLAAQVVVERRQAKGKPVRSGIRKIADARIEPIKAVKVKGL